MFIVLLSSIVNDSNHTKCVSLSNQKCKIQPTLINLYEYNQKIPVYILMNRIKKFTTIHFRLNYIVVLEVIIL